MIKTIILDFDGVLIESVSIKTQAFRKLFMFVPEHLDAIEQYHVKEMGRSRYEKFRFIYKNILKRPLSQDQCKWLSDTFSKIVFDEIKTTPYVKGAEDFLNNYYKKIPLYIVSATPELELVNIVNQRKMSHYFQKVYGSPKSKTDLITLIIQENKLSPDSVMFVGDAVNDWVAARDCGIRFIGRTMVGSQNPFITLPEVELIVPDLSDFSKYLEGLDC